MKKRSPTGAVDRNEPAGATADDVTNQQLPVQSPIPEPTINTSNTTADGFTKEQSADQTAATNSTDNTSANATYDVKNMGPSQTSAAADSNDDQIHSNSTESMGDQSQSADAPPVSTTDTLSANITYEATSRQPSETSTYFNIPKNQAAVALGRLGGLKGGRARAERLTKEELSEAARKAAKARWQKNKREE